MKGLSLYLCTPLSVCESMLYFLPVKAKNVRIIYCWNILLFCRQFKRKITQKIVFNVTITSGFKKLITGYWFL